MWSCIIHSEVQDLLLIIQQLLIPGIKYLVVNSCDSLDSNSKQQQLEKKVCESRPQGQAANTSREGCYIPVAVAVRVLSEYSQSIIPGTYKIPVVYWLYRLSVLMSWWSLTLIRVGALECSTRYTVEVRNRFDPFLSELHVKDIPVESYWNDRVATGDPLAVLNRWCEPRNIRGYSNSSNR